MHIQFTHDNMDYKNSLINATHIVSHLTFGDQLPVSVASLLDKVDAEGPGFNTLGDHEFVSEHADRTYEHFIQVGFRNDDTPLACTCESRCLTLTLLARAD